MKRHSPKLEQGVRLLHASSALLALLAATLLFEGPTKVVSHDYSRPNYSDHEHHLCHVLTLGLSVLIWWWVALVLLLYWRRGSVSRHAWATRLLGYPLGLMTLVGAPSAAYMFFSYSSHDEVTYAAVAALCNGTLLAVLALHNYSYAAYPLREDQEYAWNWLVVSWLFGAAYAANFAVAQLKLPAALSVGASLLQLAGLWTSKFVIVQKTL